MNLETLHKYEADGLLYSQKHPSLPLTIWNYTEKVQYEGLWDEVTLQCRGLVTWDETGEVVARPFKKFFNIEEGKHRATTDFEVWEKMDGSLIIAFYMWGSWIIASRGSFTSDQAKAASKLFYSRYNSKFMNTDSTYLFEFTAPWNRIVVDYGEDEILTLLGAIRIEDGLEAPLWHLEMVADLNGFSIAKRYDGIKDYNSLKSMVRDDREGFVVRFSNGDRMKVKGEEYLRLHRIMTNLSTTRVWEILSDGESMDQYLADVPDEFYSKIKEYELSLTTEFIRLRQDAIDHCAKIAVRVQDGDRKAFAELAKEYQYPSLLFSLLDGKDINSAIWKYIRPEFQKL
jgi:RNA ligase